MAEGVSSAPEVANYRALYTKVTLGSLIAIGIVAIPLIVVQGIEGAQGIYFGIHPAGSEHCSIWPRVALWKMAPLSGDAGRCRGLAFFLRIYKLRCSWLQDLLLLCSGGDCSCCRAYRLHLWPRGLFPVPPTQPPCFANWLGRRFLWHRDRGGCGARHCFGNCLHKWGGAVSVLRRG